ncbi:xanthine dehydrogenase accessory protein XdhC [Massilia sp. DWR3-1-1]|uniref:xanthine dehydrogenase accessory protein XdhC n=1 Tax=Massilia sp. DWR3-1-1 TaxID=2804559 RepID=UPI003CF13D8E
MNEAWTLAASRPVVLVTVAQGEGSVPRGAGAHMLVAADALAGTVGGGHLELRAIETGRAMLADGRQRHLERFALGPGLGQCCGGVVHLAFELLEPGHAAQLAARRRQDSWRLVALDGAGAALYDADGVLLAGAPAPAFERSGATRLMRAADGGRWLVDRIAAPRAHLLLFGAGHVGAALVSALAGLPCTVSWVDERADLFPPVVPDNVQVEACDAPEDLVAQAPAGASYLVMTHSHALDLRLAMAILACQQVGWFGLIGSHTKRRQFEHRLRERGLDGARIDAMACPIGLPGIDGKEPAVIAAAVAAQLLMLWQSADHLPVESTTIAQPGPAN